jgi:hypothetical protein
MDNLTKIRLRMKQEQDKVYELSNSAHPGLLLGTIISTMQMLMKLEKEELKRLGSNEVPGLFLMPKEFQDQFHSEVA